MRQAAKTDSNQKAIVATFRSAGASVMVLSSVGHGCPDLLVGYHGRDALVEVKGAKGKRTPDQIVWHREWYGRPVRIVRTCMDAIDLLNKVARE